VSQVKDDKAQMMVLESIFFAIMVVVALAFLVQISPTSIQSGTQSSNELKVLGDDALDTLYAETVHITGDESAGYRTNNPSNKLVVCIITNDYYNVTDVINSSLPDTALYNIYISNSNGTKTIFWCSSTGDPTDGPLRMIDPVAISHHPVSIDHVYLFGFHESLYKPDGINCSDIAEAFLGMPPYDPEFNPANYTNASATYDVILEMSDLWIS